MIEPLSDPQRLFCFMSDKPILFRPDEILTPALERMYELRPKSFQHLNLRNGVYWHPFLGFRGQTALAASNLVKLIKASRLKTAEKQELLDYVASEYDAVPDTSATFAFGEMTLSRTETVLSGDVPAGTRFSRSANLTTQIPLKAAAYETVLNAHFEVGQDTVVGVPIKAVTVGADSNHPLRTDSIAHGVSGTGLFDRTITVSAFSAAGGSDIADDNYVRRFARAFAKGQYGPTADATRYGALKSTGVRYMLAFDVPGTGTQKILVADQAWGSSQRWAKQVQQSLYDDDLVGFGCKVVADQVRNKVISVATSISLRDSSYLAETTEIDQAVRAAVKAYFDDRPDWNVWRTSALKGAITRCHPKILNCNTAVVRDVTGATLSEVTTANYATEQFHYYLSGAGGAVVTTYTGPV